MRWYSHGRRPVYQSDWVDVWLDDIEIPGVGRVDHHVVTMPRSSVTSVVVNPDGDILLIWRHRFITDAWGWEVPAGWAEPGEEREAAIRREVEEETGWRPGTVEEMTSYFALSGISTIKFTAFLVTDCTYIGAPTDLSEASKIEWFTAADVAHLMRERLICDGAALTALSYFLGVHQDRRAGD